MLYTEFVDKAIKLTITEADNGLFYLEPMWRSILDDNQLFFNNVSNFKIDPLVIEDVLKLEVEKRNTINSKKPQVIDWLYDIITNTVDPAMLEEETDYLKNVIEYMKTNHEVSEIKDEDWKKFTAT